VAVQPRLGRTAYYLVKLVGPAAPDWLQVLKGRGAEVYGSLPGFTLLVGMLPERVAEVRAEPWVEDITPYRPTMKVSPRLRHGLRRDLDADTLAAVTAEEIEDQQPQLVEVSVFPRESVNDVAARVREAGGTVLITLPRSLVASVRPSTIAQLADVQGIQAILPHALPELHNDQATLVMQVPPGHAFADITLTGTGQIVAIAPTAGRSRRRLVCRPGRWAATPGLKPRLTRRASCSVIAPRATPGSNPRPSRQMSTPGQG